MARTVLSGKGQIVIPAEIRSRLNLQKGDRFEVAAASDQIVLKRLPRNPLLELRGIFASDDPKEQPWTEELLREHEAELRRQEEKIDPLG